MNQRVVLVRFANAGSEYSFFTDIEDLKEGDVVVVSVNSPNAFHLNDGAHAEGISIGVISKISGLTQARIKRAERWIICRVPLKDFHDKMKKESLKLEIINKAMEIQQQMDQLEMLKRYADSNIEIRSLLEQYASLDPNFKLPESGSQES